MCSVFFGENAPPKVVSSAPATPVGFPLADSATRYLTSFPLSSPAMATAIFSQAVSSVAVTSIARHFHDHMTNHLHDELYFVMSRVANSHLIHQLSKRSVA